MDGPECNGRGAGPEYTGNEQKRCDAAKTDKCGAWRKGVGGVNFGRKGPRRATRDVIYQQALRMMTLQTSSTTFTPGSKAEKNRLSPDVT